MEPIILASTSPRRQEILRSLSIPFTVLTSDYLEIDTDGITPVEQAELHSIKKIESVMRMNLKITASWILAADTIVCLDNKTFGKPENREQAKNMIHTFSGKTHEVITGISLYDSHTNYISTRNSVSKVTFMKIPEETIEKYLDTGEWQGVAGGYRIQSLAACFATKIEGSYSGIVGLPIHELYAILREHGYSFLM